MTIKRILLLIPLLLFTHFVFAQEENSEQKDRIKYLGDLTIEAEEVVNGNVIVMQGDLRVKGVINGDVVTSFGDVYIDSGAVINGDVVALKGKIHVSENAKVIGETVESGLLDITFDDHNFHHHHGHKLRAHLGEKCEETFGEEGENIEECRKEGESGVRLGYNKVDGFFLGGVIPKRLTTKVLPQMSLQGWGGYGFANNRWQYYVEFDKWFFINNILELGIEAHKITDTDDEWIIDNEENSLAAFFLHEDFRDYFYRIGFGAHISQKFGNWLRLKLNYLGDDYTSANNQTDWALFGGDKKFTPNFNFLGPDTNITEGMMRSIIASGELKPFHCELYFCGSAEAAGYGLGGDFEFQRYIFESKGFFNINSHEGIDFRLKLGSSADELPPQKLFTLGGISTLRAFCMKEFYGKQMALLNLEYRLFSHKHLSRMWWLKLFQIGLFTDIGSTHQKIFSDFDAKYYKSDVGISIMDDDGETRLDIARRTDTGNKPWVVTFRIKHAF